MCSDGWISERGWLSDRCWLLDQILYDPDSFRQSQTGSGYRQHTAELVWAKGCSVHYLDRRDSSGVRFYIGKQRCPYDLGYLTLGVDSGPGALAIPPQVEQFTIDGICPKEATEVRFEMWPRSVYSLLLILIAEVSRRRHHCRLSVSTYPLARLFLAAWSLLIPCSVLLNRYECLVENHSIESVSEVSIQCRIVQLQLSISKSSTQTDQTVSGENTQVQHSHWPISYVVCLLGWRIYHTLCLQYNE